MTSYHRRLQTEMADQPTVEDRRVPPTFRRRFFCHLCNRQFSSEDPSNDSPTCPSCRSEFIEELEQEESRTVGGGVAEGGNPPSPGHPGSLTAELIHDMARSAVESARRNMEAARQRGPDSDDPMDEDVRDVFTSRGAQGGPFVRRQTPSAGTGGTGFSLEEAVRRLPRRTVIIQHQPPESFAALIQDHITRLVDLRARGSSEIPPAPRFESQIVLGVPGNWSASIPLHGRPSEYAWGPQGLDDIISQMLANLEDTGPPPAEKDKIDTLPTVEATEEELKTCAECSVCKEPFNVSESLKQLPCSHLYHIDCILPWLNLHDTCPTCRFSINTGEPASYN